MNEDNSKMTRPTRPLHDGQINNYCSFEEALESLMVKGSKNFKTNAGTPFTAQAHITSKGSHAGESCILITRDGDVRAYIYKCCWGHVTNCTRTYIDVYTKKL